MREIDNHFHLSRRPRTLALAVEHQAREDIVPEAALLATLLLLACLAIFA